MTRKKHRKPTGPKTIRIRDYASHRRSIRYGDTQAFWNLTTAQLKACLRAAAIPIPKLKRDMVRLLDDQFRDGKIAIVMTAQFTITPRA